jgi:predicted nucleic acid-binding Zn ribbon protein
MPLYTVRCNDDGCGTEVEVLAKFDSDFTNQDCPIKDCSGNMQRIGIEMQKRPHVQGGSSNARYKN